MFNIKRTRTFAVISVFCSTIIIFYILSPEVIDLEFSAEYDFECSNKVSTSIHKHICFEEPHIFFVETAQSPTLNVRQSCAIESTAHHNPSMQIYVLMTTPDDIEFHHDLMKLLDNIKNVHFVQISIDALFYGSPMFKWYRKGAWKNSKWKVSHMSDALRFYLMWKFGGAYLDMDIVTFRSYENIKNTAITENWDRVAAGILFFDKGHALLRKCMIDFAEKYDPYNFVNNGPGLFTSNLKKYCDTNIVGKISGSNCGINILPPEAAFPIVYDKWFEYFSPHSEKNVSDIFNSSYMIHVWNKFSYKYKLKVGTNSLYELAIKQHCPLTYSYAQKVGFI